MRESCMRFLSLLKNTWYAWWYEKGKIREHWVLLESKNGEDLGSNILRIAEALEGEEFQDYTCYLACNKKEMPHARALLGSCHADRINLVECGSLRYFYLLASAGFLFTDTSFPRRFIKKQGQVLVNTWHGTPFKKFGRDVLAGAYSMGNVQRNFLMADYVVCASPFVRETFADAQNLEQLYKGKYLYAGQPRNQVFFQEKTAPDIRKKLGLEEKRIYCYLPTWRGAEKAGQTQEARLRQAERIREILGTLDAGLGENEVLYVRLHPFVGQILSFEGFSHVKPAPQKLDIYELLAAADCLVTDYSSVFYDYANKKDGKVIFFPFDREEFKEERDCYLSYEELPFPVAGTVESLLLELRSPKAYDDREFLRQYCPYDGKEAAKKLCQRILLGKEVSGILEEAPKGNGKSNLLFYVGGLGGNGITASFLNLMANADREHYNYFASFQTEHFKKNPLRVGILPEFVRAVPMSQGWFLTLSEAAAAALSYRFRINCGFVRRTLEKFYKREYDRNFGGADFAWCIHYTGYERKVTGLFLQAPCRKGIFVHSDMVRELETKQNHSEGLLREAYRGYDFVAAAGKSAYDSVLALGGDKKRLRLVENCHDYRRVEKKSREEIRFDEDTVSSHSLEELKAALQKTGPKFVTVGRFSVEKGHDILLDAFARYHKEAPDSMLVIIGGGGECYEETRRRARNLGLEDCVFLIKSMANPMPVEKACDLFLLPSRYEALGLSLLEADTLGLPVICTDIPGPADFVREHGGYAAELSAEGLYEGMKAWERGGILPLHVDYEAYNRRAAGEFYDALKIV